MWYYKHMFEKKSNLSNIDKFTGFPSRPIVKIVNPLKYAMYGTLICEPILKSISQSAVQSYGPNWF